MSLVSNILLRISVALILLYTLTTHNTAFGSACCSASSQVPTLITSDSVMQLGLRTARSSVIGSSGPNTTSRFYNHERSDITYRLELLGAYALNDRWQLNASIPLTKRVRRVDTAEAEHWGLSTVALGGSYELVPEIEYSSWKPRVFLFASIGLPLSNSDEARLDLGTHIHGSTSLVKTAGFFLLKQFNTVDWNLLLAQAHDAFYTSVASVGFGWHGPEGLRLGVNIGPTYQFGSGLLGQNRLVIDTSFNLGLSFFDDYSLNINYLDQTLFGPTKNSELSRVVNLLFLRRFDL
jgi:hypothetical protein